MSETQSPTTILVVDDNPGTLYSTSRVLRSAGLEVLEARTGAEGLELAPKASLIILDINLPDMNGFEVCEKIRSNAATARTPLIHLSASFVAERDKVRGLDRGADGYLTHPVEAPVLVATVNAFLRARQAEDAMKASEAKFRAIFDQTPHGIALISDDFVYLEVNPALCNILGRTREQIVGKHNSAFMPLGHEHEAVAFAREIDRGNVWRGTSTLINSDARHIYVEWSISTFSVPGVRLALVTDITARRATEEERERLLASERAARAEAERANRLKDDFLATLSHELRTPLNAMMGWTHILRQGTPDPDDLAEGLESIDRNVSVQAQLIADLLDVSRITSGKLRLESKVIDAAAIVTAALESVTHAARAKDISIRKEFAGPTQMVADPGRLQQIVWNLVTNAIKFTPNGGTIVVEMSPTDSDMVLSIRDSGQGIPAEFLPHLFERFSQADASSRRMHGGLGLGLSIVRNLVEMHGGTVRATSEGPGRGSTFTISLPLGTSESLESPLPAVDIAASLANGDSSHAAPTLTGIRVVIVDDDQDARKVLSRLLVDFDAQVQQAESVSQAMKVIEAFEPHVVVTDIGMPILDGYDLVRLLRSREDALARTPVIALTAFVGRENSARMLQSGFQVHLAKPVNPSILVMEIRKLTTG